MRFSKSLSTLSNPDPEIPLRSTVQKKKGKGRGQKLLESTQINTKLEIKNLEEVISMEAPNVSEHMKRPVHQYPSMFCVSLKGSSAPTSRKQQEI